MGSPINAFYHLVRRAQLYAEVWINAPHVGARVRWAAAAQSVNSGTFTALTFDTVRYDPFTLWSAGSNTRFTVPANFPAGVWQIGAHANFAANVTGKRYIGVRLNGGTFLGGQEFSAGANNARKNSIATNYRLVPGDYVELVVWQDSTVALTVDSTSADSPEFWIEFKGRA